MDATSLFFVIVVVVLGGPLAYFADQLGRKLGKKRLSVLGLRPRHTATLLTVSAGILIPLITVLVMVGLSSGVREWVLHGSRALEEKRQLEIDKVRLRGDIKDQDRRLKEGGVKLGDIDLKYRHELGLAKALERRTKVLSKQIKELNTRLDKQRKILAGRELDVKRLTAEVKLRAASIASINAELAQRQAELKTARSSYNKLNKEYLELDQNRTKLDQQNQQLQGQIDRLKPEIEDLKTQRAEQERQLGQAKDDLITAQGELTKTKNELVTAQDDFKKFAGAWINEPMIYAKDTEVVRLTVEPGLSADDARRAVETLLSMAREEGLHREAGSTEDINLADFISIQRPVPMTPIEVKSNLIRRILNLREPAVLIATTPVNVFRTQPVPLVASLKPNPLVYRAGQTIAETRIDGRKEWADVFQQLGVFLSERVTQQAITDQMIPRVREGTPPFGEINTRQISDVVDAIRAEGRSVRLRAVAKVDTHAADPLQLEFKVVK